MPYWDEDCVIDNGAEPVNAKSRIEALEAAIEALEERVEALESADGGK